MLPRSAPSWPNGGKATNTLGLEARDDLLGVHAQLNDLERHAAADRLFLFGHPDAAHAAFADLLKEFVATDTVTGFFR